MEFPGYSPSVLGQCSCSGLLKRVNKAGSGMVAPLDETEYAVCDSCHKVYEIEVSLRPLPREKGSEVEGLW